MFLSQQKYACCDKHVCQNKTFVATNICLDKHNFVTTKVLLQQAYFCRDKHVFVATKVVFCCDKSMLVMTNFFFTTNMCLAWQTFCRIKKFTCGTPRQWCITTFSVARSVSVELPALPHKVFEGQCLSNYLHYHIRIFQCQYVSVESNCLYWHTVIVFHCQYLSLGSN